MTQPKFAPVTATLLARKGEARPWGDSPFQAQPASELGRFQSRVLGRTGEILATGNSAFVPPLTIAASSPGLRRLTVRVSQSEYERLGLIAAKRDITRQRLLHQMLDDFLAAASCEYGGDCECIGGNCRHHG